MVWESQCLELDFLQEVSVILITIVIFGFFFLFPALIPNGHGCTGGQVPPHDVHTCGNKSPCTRYTPSLGDSACP